MNSRDNEIINVVNMVNEVADGTYTYEQNTAFFDALVEDEDLLGKITTNSEFVSDLIIDDRELIDEADSVRGVIVRMLTAKQNYLNEGEPYAEHNFYRFVADEAESRLSGESDYDNDSWS